MILPTVLLVLTTYALYTWICLERNIRLASHMDIPLVRQPIDSNNVLWMIIEPYIWKVVDSFPFAWSSYPASVRYLRRGWHFREKNASHVRLGPIWALVSAGRINVHVADREAVGEVFSRRREFVRPIENYKILEVFGPCISTADADNWPRHRKALAAPFNESVMSFVWDESLRQSRGMVESWMRSELSTKGKVPSFQRDTRSVSLNVLAAVGFRQSYDFVGSSEHASKGSEIDTYREALQTVLDSAILLMLVPYKLLTLPLMPKRWAHVGAAGDAFKKYMVQMLDEETQASKRGRAGAGGIMTSLVHALDAYHNDIDTKNNSSKTPSSSNIAKGLSVNEIFGNIFVINFAGHDTTANTLAFAMLLLVTHPDVQEWVADELHQVVGEPSIDPGSYEKYYAQLLRCKAILYETLRLYPPIMALPKGTDHHSQTLRVQGRDIPIPPNSDVTLSILACHTNPDVWHDALEWRPSRWIVPSASAVGRDIFYTPPLHSYFPWSDGPQICPGKKFAEVEFVAVLANLLWGHRVNVKRLGGETDKDTYRRVSETINNVNMEMLLRMQDADRVRLTCVTSKA